MSNSVNAVTREERHDALPLFTRRGEVVHARLRWLTAWIDANLAERIPLHRLCEVSGVGSRSLQKAFRSTHRTSPMGYVLARRLAAARALLSDAPPGQGVTSIATACGFTHFGRFAVCYRETYGESPSQTLWRGRFRS